MHAVHNARIQLLATALNNLGVGAFIAGVVAPMVQGNVAPFPQVIVWWAVGSAFISVAQAVLGRLR